MTVERTLRSFLCVLGAALAGISSAPPIAAESDAEVEECLATGEITESDEVLVGLTKPLKVRLDCDGHQRKAVFKYLDVSKQGLYHLADGSREFNFSDRYQYERAAYLLDRELGLGMVPVAVLRTFKGKQGVLVDWIHGAVNGKQLSDGLPGSTLAVLERQKSVMRLFDSLIYNVDRRPENFLFNETTGKLYLIDHSRSFRIEPSVQAVFADNRIWMSEDLLARLRDLELERLLELTRGLIGRGQVKAVLKRRDRVLEKIEQDRETYGDEHVLVSETW